MDHRVKRFLHRAVWQRLPRALRRSLLIRATTMLAPRPTPAPPASDRIIVAGYLTACSGLGESARLCYEALRDSKRPVSGIDLSSLMIQGDDRQDFRFVDGRQEHGPASLMLHVNAPWVPLALASLGRRFVQDKRIIGCWNWELPEVPDEWQTARTLVHEVWAGSRFTADAIARKMPGLKVRVVHYPVAVANAASPFLRQPHDPFVVLVIFNVTSSFARKNPIAAINAFRTAFGDDPTARLVVKATYIDRHLSACSALQAATKGAGNIEIIARPYTPQEMDTLYRRADVVLSLHRSEGFGLVLAEAMLRGIPVVATGWSGTVDFHSADNGMPVRYALTPAVDPQGEYDLPSLNWADPDVQEASEKLRQLRNDPELRQRLGRNAQRDALAFFSKARYLAKVHDILDAS